MFPGNLFFIRVFYFWKINITTLSQLGTFFVFVFNLFLVLTSPFMLCYAFNLLMAFDRLLLKGLLTYLLMVKHTHAAYTVSSLQPLCLELVASIKRHLWMRQTLSCLLSERGKISQLPTLLSTYMHAPVGYSYIQTLTPLYTALLSSAGTPLSHPQ